MRFGTRTELKRCWTPQGHRPTALLIADRATTHQAALTQNTTITLAQLPTAGPELNPVELFFKQMRAQLANTVFDSLEQAQQKVTQVFKQLTDSAENMIRLTVFPYIQNENT